MTATDTQAHASDLADAEASSTLPSETEKVATRLNALEAMSPAALRSEWRRLYRVLPPKRVARELLILGVAWKLQEQALGGLDTTTKRSLASLVQALERDGDVRRNRIGQLKPGAKL